MAESRLAGRVALITGGTSGIGRASALLFAREGASVVIGGRDAERGSAVVNEINRSGSGDAAFVRVDVSRPEDVERFVAEGEARFGRLDILYASAGVAHLATAPETAIEDWRRVVDVNLGGPFFLAKYGIPALARAGGGVLILTASEMGFVGVTASVAYCAAKGGVVNMVRALAVDCAPLGIRVNGLAPGPTATPMLTGWFEGSPDPAAMERAQLEPVPLRRFGRPEELAQAALFLASDASTFVTGTTLVVDGGATAWYGM